MTTIAAAVVGTWGTVALARAARRAAVGGRVRSIGTHWSWRLPARPRRRLERALADSAVELGPEEVCELAAAGAIGATILAIAITPRMAPLVGIAGLAALPVGLRVTRGRSRARFDAALPDVLERVASSLRAGTRLGEAIEAQAGGGPVGFDLRRVRARQALGLGLGEAVAVWPDERPLPSVRAAAGALAVATTMGGRSASAIDGLATSLREHRSVVADARALSAQARLSAVVVGAAPVGYLAFNALVDPDSVDVLVRTGVGRACLVAGVVLEVAAVLCMRRIVGSEG